MRLILFAALFFSIVGWADTPPPGTVKAKVYSGDGNTPITATMGSLDVHVTNNGGATLTVDQGAAGVQSWLTQVTSSALPANACQETGGNLASIVAELAAPLPLPTGASTSAKQPALGTSGTASADVITVQGIAGMTAVKVDGSAVTQPVSGTFWQATQPVSAASLPLPSGAATSARQAVPGAAGTPSAEVVSVQGVTSMTPLKTDGSGFTQPVSGSLTVEPGSGTFLVDGSAHTQPVSAASLPLPTGAATEAKQPSLGTAGSPSSNVITVQGVTSMTALKVDGSGVTQPVSGTFWQATQPVSGTFFQATQPVSGTFWQATQPVSLVTLPSLAAGSAIIGKVGIDQTTPGTTNGVQVNAALPAGSNIIGNFRIDQTTPGTTNGVQVNAALPAGSNVIGHVIVDTAPTTAVTQSGTWNVNATPAVPTATTVKQAAITIGTSAVRLTTDGSAPSSTRTLLVAQLLSTSTANCYMGSSSVTSTSTGRGVQMFAGQVFSFTGDAGDYYAICDSSSQTFFVTEQE